MRQRVGWVPRVRQRRRQRGPRRGRRVSQARVHDCAVELNVELETVCHRGGRRTRRSGRGRRRLRRRRRDRFRCPFGDGRRMRRHGRTTGVVVIRRQQLFLLKLLDGRTPHTQRPNQTRARAKAGQRGRQRRLARSWPRGPSLGRHNRTASSSDDIRSSSENAPWTSSGSPSPPSSA